MFPHSAGTPIFEKTPIGVMRNLVEVGCIKPEALEIMASFWRNVNIDFDTHWQDIRKLNSDFFTELDNNKLLQGDPVFLIDHWLFPLYPLDLSLERVNREELKKIQNDYYSSEGY